MTLKKKKVFLKVSSYITSTFFVCFQEIGPQKVALVLKKMHSFCLVFSKKAVHQKSATGGLRGYGPS